jgi:hypothetical protein
MNYRIKDIMYTFDLTEQAARDVYYEMIGLEIDMSECSENEYAWAKNYAYNKWRMAALKRQKIWEAA